MIQNTNITIYDILGNMNKAFYYSYPTDYELLVTYDVSTNSVCWIIIRTQDKRYIIVHRGVFYGHDYQGMFNDICVQMDNTLYIQNTINELEDT